MGVNVWVNIWGLMFLVNVWVNLLLDLSMGISRKKIVVFRSGRLIAADWITDIQSIDSSGLAHGQLM